MTSVGPGAPDASARLTRNAAVASLCVALFLVGLKALAWVQSGSVALLSTLTDSLMDAAASLVNLLAVLHAMRPADDEHRFGHGKAEPVAALAQAAIVTGTALLVLLEGVRRISDPQPIAQGGLAIAVLVATILINIALVSYQSWVVRRTGSTAIAADRLHYQTDMLLNFAVIAAVLAADRLGWRLADPILAIIVALVILWGARGIGLSALDMLMDRELPEDERARIEALALAHPEVRSLHQLRTRSAGPHRFIQLHLRMDATLTLLQAHEISHEVQAEIRAAYPGSDVLIHEEPAGPA